jgi:hypothetical protein
MEELIDLQAVQRCPSASCSTGAAWIRIRLVTGDNAQVDGGVIVDGIALRALGPDGQGDGEVKNPRGLPSPCVRSAQGEPAHRREGEAHHDSAQEDQCR